MVDPVVPVDPTIVKQIVAELGNQQINAYLEVVSATLLVYEVIANLRFEIEYIWMWKWSSVTVLYLFQRYLPFLDTAVFSLHNQFGVDMSAHWCSLERKIIGWSFVVGILASEILLTLRVWAVWNMSISVGIGLLIFFLGCSVGSFVALDEFVCSIIFASPSYPGFRGCFAIAASTAHLSTLWSLFMAFDTGTLMMILIPGVKAYRKGGRSELLKTIYRDGVLYYALITLLSAINVIVIFTLPVGFITLLLSSERVLHSTMTSRAVLQIRQVASLCSTFSISDENSHWQVATRCTQSRTHSEWDGLETLSIVAPEPEHKEENPADLA